MTSPARRGGVFLCPANVRFWPKADTRAAEFQNTLDFQAPTAFGGVKPLAITTKPTTSDKLQANLGSVMKTLLAMAVLGITTSSHAETLSFPLFRVEVEDDWVHSVEEGPQAHHDWGGLISIYYPNGVGKLKMQSYSAPDSVSKEILRNMTNVDSSKALTLQNWGDYSGYQYDYIERGSFYRQWWITNAKTFIFITYTCNAESKDIEIDEINRIVSSLTVNKP